MVESIDLTKEFEAYNFNPAIAIMKIQKCIYPELKGVMMTNVGAGNNQEEFKLINGHRAFEGKQADKEAYICTFEQHLYKTQIAIQQIRDSYKKVYLRKLEYYLPDKDYEDGLIIIRLIVDKE